MCRSDDNFLIKDCGGGITRALPLIGGKGIREKKQVAVLGENDNL
jgi:hypothetical protein